jgi:branched-chain amino acid transport system substrate-binding protein
VNTRRLAGKFSRGALALALLLVGMARAEEAPIKIGILGPFTGSLAFNGEEMKKGMLLALDDVNAKGGLFGRKVELVFGDTEAKPDVGVAAVKKMITRDKVLAVGGGYASSVNIATTEVCEREKTPVVVAIAISPTITSRGFKYVFRTSPDSQMFLDGTNRWLAEVKKPKKVAFLMENSDYGRDAEKIWSAVAKSIGAEEVAHLYFQIGDTDFSTQITKLKQLNPDVTFSIASTVEAALIQKQAKEQSFATQWIGAGGHFTAAYFKMAGASAQFAMGNSLEPTLATKDPVVAEFVRRYEAKNSGARPGVFSGQGYDNLMVILDGIRRAGKPTGDLEADRDRVRTALATTDMKLTQGQVKFDARGQVVTVKPYVVQVTLAGAEPKLSIVYPPEKATAAYAAPLPWDKR